MRKLYLIVLIIFTIIIMGCSGHNQLTESVDDIKHIDTSITDNLESFNKDFLAYYPLCNSDNDCESKYIKETCFKCPNSKLVFSKGECGNKPGIIFLDSNGICTHSAGFGMDMYYNKECMPTQSVYCIINFNNQEIPTISPIESLKYLPIWKEELIKKSGISEQYFKEHFFIYSSDILVNDYYNKTYFEVRYLYNIDWVTVSFVLNGDKAIIDIGNQKNYLLDEEIRKNFEINFNHQINRILSKKEVDDKLKTCYNGMDTDNIKDIKIENEGKMILYAFDTVSSKDNICKIASLDLETGEMLSCHDTSCRVE